MSNTVEGNAKYLKKNAIRVNKRAGVKACFNKVRLMEGSALTLKHHVELARVQGYEKLMHRLTKAYGVSMTEMVDILARMMTFNKAQRTVFMKLVHGEPLSLPNNDTPKQPQNEAQNK